MSNAETYRDTLRYALAIAGSERELAERLGTNVRQVETWLRGVEEVPDSVFLAALDVVIHSTPQAIRRSRGVLLQSVR